MIKKAIQTFIKTVQRISITVSLLLVYIFGIGVTALRVIPFNRWFSSEKGKEKNTFWIEVKEHESDIDNHLRQS